jgi:hypothetical protein
MERRAWRGFCRHQTGKREINMPHPRLSHVGAIANIIAIVSLTMLMLLYCAV